MRRAAKSAKSQRQTKRNPVECCPICEMFFREEHDILGEKGLRLCRKCKAFRLSPDTNSKICYHCFMQGGGDGDRCPVCAKPN